MLNHCISTDNGEKQEKDSCIIKKHVHEAARDSFPLGVTIDEISPLCVYECV